MKKIGLIGVTNHNYGSILQTYALQNFLERYNNEVELFNYREPKLNKISRLFDVDYLHNVIDNLQRTYLCSLVNKSLKEGLKARNLSFIRFKKEYLHISPLLKSKREICEYAKTKDSIVLGSDQVWHPANLKMDYFTLNAIPDDVKKITYAPSFGVSVIQDVYKTAYKTYISRIQYLSCREKSGVALIHELTGRDAEWVCDPTLLMNCDAWNGVTSEKVTYNFPYIFCYFIGDNPNQRQLVKKMAEEKGLKIVALLHIDKYIQSDEYYADYTPYNVGPAEFLNLIKEASYVMTDSFHATVFSLLFHCEFFTFNRFESSVGKSTTSRIDSLLSVVKLANRKVPTGTTVNYILEQQMIDFENIDQSLEKFRASSVSYLNSALNG